MALRDQPYLPLYVQDFLTDERLNECSAESTGVYIRLMCIMHKSQEYGSILLKQKDKQNDSKISNFALKLVRQMPYDAGTIERSLTELIDEGVLILDGDRLFQKRMVKDGKLSDTRALAARSKKGSKQNSEFCSDFADDFAPAKQVANSENENESENDNEFVNESEGEAEKNTPPHARPNVQAERFSEFWSAYPKKVGKGAAEKAWQKIKPDADLHRRILAAIADAKESVQWQKDNGQYIPNPSTWLNQSRWEDELTKKGGGFSGTAGGHNAEFKPSTGFRKTED